MFCRNCGEHMNDNQAICLKCGVETGKGNHFCPNCGKDVNPNASVCLSCGVKLVETATTATPSNNLNGKDKMTVIILCLFLGGIGIHNFFMGESKKGILRLLLCWFGIGSILALIDLIKILTDSYKYNPNAWV